MGGLRTLMRCDFGKPNFPPKSNSSARFFTVAGSTLGCISITGTLLPRGIILRALPWSPGNHRPHHFALPECQECVASHRHRPSPCGSLPIYVDRGCRPGIPRQGAPRCGYVDPLAILESLKFSHLRSQTLFSSGGG
jgi:hypothetical protein